MLCGGLLVGCASSNGASQVTLSQLRRAYVIEERKLDRLVHDCMKRSGRAYQKSTDATVRFLGLMGLDPVDRTPMAKQFGYGVALQYRTQSVPKGGENAGFIDELVKCENLSRAELPLYKFRRARQSFFDASMFDRYRSAQWRSAEKLWSMCMKQAGFGSENSMTAWLPFRDRAEQIPESPDRKNLLDVLQQEEIPMAKADDRCRVSYLDKLDGRYQGEVAKDTFFSSLSPETRNAIRTYLTGAPGDANS